MRRLRAPRGLVPILVGSALAVVMGCAIPLPTVQPLTVIEPVEEAQQVLIGDAERASVRLRLLSRELAVRGGGDVGLMSARFTYNVAEWAPRVRQETEGGVLSVYVDQGLGTQLPLGRGDRHLNAWDVTLARNVPLDLEVDMGAGDAALDLSGLALEKLTVTLGSTDLALSFNSLNARPLSTLRLTAGTGAVNGSGLGNANFDTMYVLGGTGTLDLDFSGAYQRSALVDVKAGAGRIKIRVPGSIGVRVSFSDLVSVGGVNAEGFLQDREGVFTNVAYGVAPLTLTVNVATGIGSITLISQ